MFFPFLKEEAQQRGEHTHTGSKETAHRAVTAENTLLGVSLSYNVYKLRRCIMTLRVETHWLP